MFFQDDIVKLIRSAPIEDSSHIRPQAVPATKQESETRLEQGSYDYWSSQYTTPSLWDLDPEESKDYDDDESDSDSASTEVTDTDDTNSDASELDFTWELNTDHQLLESKQDTKSTRSSG